MARAIGGRVPQTAPAPREEARFLSAQNRLLKRGATLHTTTALTRPQQTDSLPGSAATRWEGMLRFDDGRQLGVDNRSNHWKFARRLLDMVMPKPSSDHAVLDWYRASSSALLRDFQMHADHFDQALRLFPDDPLLLMFAGSLHEDLASARVQEFIRSAVVPPGVTLRVGSSKTELERAEALLRRSVKIDARAPDARVRLGRVLSLQTRYADALTELRQLDASAPQMLQYYAALFTGDAAEALGRRDDARAAYGPAAKLYPQAQAPRFALSQLALRDGDTPGAVKVLENVLSMASKSAADNDPFWTYHTAAGRDTAALLTQAYRALSEAGSP
jgi:tetratricopeptide (TPR) repeat protein